MKSLSRRHFLRGAGASVALPLLGAMTPAWAAEPKRTPRFVAICGGLGFHKPHLFPEAPGRDWRPTPYLEHLADHRERLTLFGGLSHPEQNGNNGHASSLTWLTGALRPGLAGFRNTISLDQAIAAHLGGVTRLPFLCLSNDNQSLSWTAGGVNIPSESSPTRLFKTLFVDGTAEQAAAQMSALRRGRSILDTVQAEARRLDRSLGGADRAKLGEYLAAVRDLEVRIGQSERWATRPKPQTGRDVPQDVADRLAVVARQRLTYDMMALALQTDSTRVVTLSLGGMNAAPSDIHGVKTDWHNLSHHGKDEAKIAELRLIEEAEFAELGRFLTSLAAIDDGAADLLDETAVLFGSNLGNASAHDWRNLPILLAGGGYRHGAYVAHDEDDNTPLANLFVALAQRMGLPIDAFATSTAAGVRGLEPTA